MKQNNPGYPEKNRTGHELLAPAGAPEICRAVLNAGADAVYLGGEKYGARAFAANFSQQDVLEALDFAHLRDKKIFLTVNTLLKNKEMGQELFEYLKPCYRHGLDAIIVQDFGVFQFVRKYFPELPVHASTQMSAANIYGARFLMEQGAQRIVTARELSFGEIRSIYQSTGVEIESFVHGALCYCYSGQCLMSSLLGGRSGNRGRCAQPCRLPYQVQDANGTILRKKEKYPLSPKDLCALELIPQMCEAGIYSFKIEGRMKSLEYAAGVTQIYRKYLDMFEQDPGHFQVDPKDYEALLALGNRSGFTKGYYEMRNGRSMMALRDSSHSSGDAKSVFCTSETPKIPVSGRVWVCPGEPMRLTLSAGETEISVSGEIPQTAQNRPLTSEDVSSRFSKTGDTPFAFEKLEVSVGDSCFVPVKQLNELRRAGLDQLKEALLGGYRRETPVLDDECTYGLRADDVPYRAASAPTEHVLQSTRTSMISDRTQQTGRYLNVTVSTPEQLTEVLTCPFVDMVSLDFHGRAAGDANLINDCREKIKEAGKQAAFCFPYIFRENTSAFYEDSDFLRAIASFDRLWARSYDSLGFLYQHSEIRREQIALDQNLYVFSETACRAFEAAGMSEYTASFELNRRELRHMPNEHAEYCIYGYLPVMISAQCVYKNYDHCLKDQDVKTEFSLTDRYLKKFFIKRDCQNCYNVIYNGMPLYLLHEAAEIEKLHFGSYRICFNQESPAQIRRVLDEYRMAFTEGKALQPPAGKNTFTTGHYKRGVD